MSSQQIPDFSGLFDSQVLAGQFYRLNDEPSEFYTRGMAEFAGAVVQVEKLEDLHCGVRGARVRLLDGSCDNWIALCDMCGDNILWDVYMSLLESINSVWLSDSVQGGLPFEHAAWMVGVTLQVYHGISQPEPWIGAVREG